MTIWSRVYTALSGLGIPLAASVYQVPSGQTYPAVFMVYSLISSPTEQHADNAETLRSYRVQISIYKRTGLEGLPDVDTAMRAAGFISSGMREIPFNTSTEHYGLAKDYIYLE